jgi:hypothetical protein
MSPDQAINAMRQRSDTIMAEATRIEGSLRVIHDLAGFGAAKAAVDRAIQRLPRSDNDNDGWIR